MQDKSAQQRAIDAGCPVLHFDPEADEKFGIDPTSRWDEAFQNGPLFYSTGGRGFFAPSSFETVQEVMQNPAVYSSNDNFNYSRNHVVIDLIPFNLDPPEHLTYRRPLIPLLSPAAVARREPRIREAARTLAHEAAKQTNLEFMSAFAHRLPGIFFLEWLGLDPGQAEEHLQRAIRTTYLSSDEDPDGSIRASIAAAISENLLELFERRRLEPADDIASELVRIEVHGRPLTDRELVQIGDLLFSAGLETTAGTLGYIFLHLAEHPEQRAKLVENPSITATATEELLRVYSGTAVVGRTVKQPTTLAGCPLEPGDRIFLPLPGINRNMAGTSPGEVDLERKPNRHAVFGLGQHRCLGAHVARAEIRIALEEWHAVIPDYRVQPGSQLRHHHSFMTSLYELPLEIGVSK
jgi:cytochrome P450